jgi:hypothetical protein
MVFSGYPLEAIRARPDAAAQELLAQTDILVDGPYVRELPETRRRWIGSANQRVHFLTDRYRADDPCWRRPNTLELRWVGGELTVNGFPAAGAAVSRFEADLLRILHGLLRRAPRERIVPLVLNRCPRPPCLSPAAVALVQEALGKGCVWLLARGGGWLRQRQLRGGRVVEGRLWERTPPAELGLTFSRHVLGFLLWLTASRPGDPQPRWDPGASEWTVGDRVFLYFAHEVLRDTPVAPALREQPAFAGHVLCRLAFPADFAELSGTVALDWAPWIAGTGACVLEALQPVLAQRWVEVERSKAQIINGQRMRALGRIQERILGGFLEAVEAAGRRDLARFVLEAASRLLAGSPAATAWTAALDVSQLRLADRTATYQAAVAFLRQLRRLREWERQARGVGYFDEGYVASQLWKADWEHWQGETLADKADAVMRQLEPLAV